MAIPRWLTSALAFDPSGMQWRRGARAAVGVATPLVVGAAFGHTVEGAQAAAGALPVGVAAMTGTFRPPTALMLTTTAGMSLSAFVGSLLAGHVVVMLLALALWGFLAGLMVTVGRAATIVGVQAVVGFVVFGRYPGGVDQSFVHALWVAAGGLIQLAASYLLRAPRWLGPERDATASVLDRLSVLARGAVEGADGGPAADAVTQAREVVGRHDPDLPGLAEVRALVDETARIRLELQALSTFPAVSGSGRATAAASVWLAHLADCVRTLSDPGEETTELAAAVEDLRQARHTTAQRFVAARSTALLGQLRAAHRMTARLVGVRRVPLPRVAGIRETVDVAPRAYAAARRLQVALDPEVPALRHAIRLAVLLPIAEIIGRALPWPRGYWVTLTVVVVLKPDYAATVQRGIARIIGTGGGVVVAAVVVATLHPRSVVLGVVVGVFAWASYAFFSASYAVFSFTLTAVVVLLVSTFDPRPLSAVQDRGYDTLIGGALAMLGYLIWPTREAESLRSALASLLAALADYADAVLIGYVDPSRIDGERLDATSRAVRRARAEAQASLDRALAEPQHARPDTEVAVSVLAGSRRVVVALHALRTTLQDANEHVALPEVQPVVDRLVESLRALSVGGTVAGTLRDDQHGLADAATAGDPLQLRTRRLALLAAHLDPLVDSIDTIGHVVGAG